MGFDCVTIMDAQRARGLKDAGLRFAVRYLGSLTKSERDVILDAGLSLMPVTYSRAQGWLPTPGLGHADGQSDLVHLAVAGIPEGCTVWIDLEGCAGNAASASAWVEERASVLSAGGFDVGLYVGAYQPLDGAELYSIPSVHKYWRSLSDNIPEPSCGWSMYQLFPTTVIAGTEVDVDVVQQDHRGRLPMVLGQG